MPPEKTFRGQAGREAAGGWGPMIGDANQTRAGLTALQPSEGLNREGHFDIGQSVGVRVEPLQSGENVAAIERGGQCWPQNVGPQAASALAQQASIAHDLSRAANRPS